MISIDRFTESAQEIAGRSAEIMQRYSHNQIDIEHMLLALIEQPQGDIPQLLEFLKVDSNALSERLDDILRNSSPTDIVSVGPGQVSITPGVVRVITLAHEEANRQNELISTEHLFLAIFSEPNTQTAQHLEGVGLNRDRVSDAIQQLRG